MIPAAGPRGTPSQLADHAHRWPAARRAPTQTRRRRRCPAEARAAAAPLSEGQALSLFSPSKVNLFLRVVRRRDDGYHDLASLFHVIDLGDGMEFTLLPDSAEKDELRCDMAGVPTDDSNLVIKALNLFRERTGTSQRFSVRLDKVVPHGAGLGGGSGNAATALWAANEAAGRPASTQQLLVWSAAIGSDISVFFSRGAAYCTGRGEIVRDVAPPLGLGTPLLLVKPPVGLSTPAIFRALDLAARSDADPEQLLASFSGRPPMSQSQAVNDLEPPAFSMLPELRELKQRLQQESDGAFDAVFMTGSGSTMVGIGSQQVPAFLSEPQYSDVFVAKARLITREADAWYQAPLAAEQKHASLAGAAA